MKMKIFAVFMLILCIVCVCIASYDTPPRPKASPDLMAYIIETPADVYEKHGYSERTAIMYNLAKFKELYIESAKQIQTLDLKVKVLQDRLDTWESLSVSGDEQKEGVPIEGGEK